MLSMTASPARSAPHAPLLQGFWVYCFPRHSCTFFLISGHSLHVIFPFTWFQMTTLSAPSPTCHTHTHTHTHIHTHTHAHMLTHTHSLSNPFPDVFLHWIYHNLTCMFSLFTVYLLSTPDHKIPEDKDSHSFLCLRGMNSVWHIVSTQTVVDVLTGGQQGL